MKNYYKKAFLITLVFAGMTAHSFSQSNMFMRNSERGGIYNSDFPEAVILKKNWSVKTGGKIFGTASARDGVVYFGSDDSCMYAVENNGNIKWKVKTDGRIRSTPAIKDNALYFHNYKGTFYALNIQDGTQLWKFETDGDARFADFGINGNTPKDKMLEDPWDVFQSSPVYDDSTLYVGCGKFLYALKIKDGALAWKFSAPNVIHSSPALSHGKLYVGCWDSKMYAINAKTGEKIWDYQTGLDPNNHLMAGIQSSPVVVDSFVIFGSRDANLYALHATTGKIIWKNGAFNGSWMPSSFAVLNDTIYTGSSDAMSFFAINKVTGKTIYSIKLPCYAFSTPAYSNGTVFIGSGNGSLYCLDVQARKIKARFDTDGHKANYLNALKPDGTLNSAVFPNTPVYEENVRWCEILFSTGTVFTSPVIENSVVYFGSTDSSFYSIQDAGGDKFHVKVSSPFLQLYKSIGSVAIDTFIYVTNEGTIKDTFEISKTGSVSKFSSALTIEPTTLYLAPGESQKVKFKGNFDFSTTSTAKFQVLSTSYEYAKEIVTLSLKIATGFSALDNINIKGAYPNPFQEYTTIEYQVEKQDNVSIYILNNLGQVVQQATLGKERAGNYSYTWNGNNGLKGVSSGIYYCLIKTNSSIKSIPIIKK